MRLMPPESSNSAGWIVSAPALRDMEHQGSWRFALKDGEQRRSRQSD
jgi:hypothetical protein